MNRNADHPHLHRHTRRPAQRPDPGTRGVANDLDAPTFEAASFDADDRLADEHSDDDSDDGSDEDIYSAARGTSFRDEEVEVDGRFGQDHSAAMADPWPTDPRWSPQDLYPQGGFDDAFGWDMRVGGVSSLRDPDPEAAWNLDDNHIFYGEEFGGGAHNAGRSVEPAVREKNRAPKGYVRTDSRIHEDVCEAFTALDDISDADLDKVEVSVKEGEVTLQGVARDRLTKFRLERCAAEARGVKDVHNKLRVHHNPFTDAFHR